MNIIETVFGLSPSLREQRQYELQQAIKQGNVRGMETSLKSEGWIINKPLPNGEMPLHYAVREEQEACVDALLQEGADIEVLDHQRLSALDHAKLMNNTSLLAHMIGYRMGHDLKTINEQMQHKGSSSHVHDLLYKVDHLNKQHGLTHLHKAILEHRLEAFREMIASGENVLVLTASGDSLLHYAAACGAQEFIPELIKLGVDPNHQNSDGETALHYCGARSDLTTVEMLIRAGADPRIVDNNDLSSLALIGVRAFDKDPIAVSKVQIVLFALSMAWWVSVVGQNWVPNASQYVMIGSTVIAVCSELLYAFQNLDKSWEKALATIGSIGSPLLIHFLSRFSPLSAGYQAWRIYQVGQSALRSLSLCYNHIGYRPGQVARYALVQGANLGTSFAQGCRVIASIFPREKVSDFLNRTTKFVCGGGPTDICSLSGRVSTGFACFNNQKSPECLASWKQYVDSMCVAENKGWVLRDMLRDMHCWQVREQYAALTGNFIDWSDAIKSGCRIGKCETAAAKFEKAFCDSEDDKGQLCVDATKTSRDAICASGGDKDCEDVIDRYLSKCCESKNDVSQKCFKESGESLETACRNHQDKACDRLFENIIRKEMKIAGPGIYEKIDAECEDYKKRWLKNPLDNPCKEAGRTKRYNQAIQAILENYKDVICREGNNLACRSWQSFYRTYSGDPRSAQKMFVEAECRDEESCQEYCGREMTNGLEENDKIEELCRKVLKGKYGWSELQFFKFKEERETSQRFRDPFEAFENLFRESGGPRFSFPGGFPGKASGQFENFFRESGGPRFSFPGGFPGKASGQIDCSKIDVKDTQAKRFPDRLSAGLNLKCPAHAAAYLGICFSDKGLKATTKSLRVDYAPDHCEWKHNITREICNKAVAEIASAEDTIKKQLDAGKSMREICAHHGLIN